MSSQTTSLGSFCWLEFMTMNPKATREFFGSLLHTTFQEMPMPGGTYTMVGINNANFGGINDLSHTAMSKNVPPHILGYIAVQNTDETLAKALRAGGTVVAPAFDVGMAGRMAIVADPTGASFALWQAKGSPGTTADPMSPGAPCWWELLTTNLKTAIPFYENLFGWTCKTTKDVGHEYVEVMVNGKHIGGMMAMTSEMGSMPSNWGVYFNSSNCDETVAQAKKLGAKVCVEPRDIPTVGRFAVLQGPDQIVFNVFTSLKPMMK